jgi:hypothetical protein
LPSSYSLANASACVACPSGSFSGAAAGTCTCLAGYASSGAGASLSCTRTKTVWLHDRLRRSRRIMSRQCVRPAHLAAAAIRHAHVRARCANVRGPHATHVRMTHVRRIRDSLCTWDVSDPVGTVLLHTYVCGGGRADDSWLCVTHSCASQFARRARTAPPLARTRQPFVHVRTPPTHPHAYATAHVTAGNS